MELLLKVTQLLSVKAASGSCPPAFTSGQSVSALECDDPLMNKRWGGGTWKGRTESAAEEGCCIGTHLLLETTARSPRGSLLG